MENEDEYNEDEDNLAFLPADHPLLGRLQGALTKQLTDEHERVDLELIEVEANLKKLEREKEDIGVRLYSVQQQLADNQINFEQAHENYNLVQRLHLEADQKLKTENETYQQKKKELEELRKKYIKAQDELSKLTQTLHQIEDYNEQMKGEIAVTKRTTYRAEENVVGLETGKKKQDLLIDSMNEEIKRQTEQKTILTAQLISQKEETEQARQILKEAHLEMQKIIASKKNLLERWQKSLMTMQRMDNALQAIKDALKSQQELNVQICTELNGVNHEIKKEQQTHSQLDEKQNRLQRDQDLLKQKNEDLEEERKKLHAQITLLSKSLHQTEVEVHNADVDKKNIDEQMIMIENNIMNLHTETKKLYEKLVHSKSEHTTIEKTASNLNKQAHLIEIDIEEKLVEQENLRNEIARVKIDKLNTESQIETLEGKKKEVIKEREEKEITVATYEVQIRQGHDLNEKKQHEVGGLNKRYEELQSNATDSNKGPLEANKAKWIRQTEEIREEVNNMHRDWIRKQRQLVKQTNDLQDNESLKNQLQTKRTILEQKKLRLNTQYRGYEKDIREIRNSHKNLQNEMIKLNNNIYFNQEKKQKLENENFNIMSEFIEKLKDLEKESVRLEVEIDKLKEQKADLLQDIIECERQILLWERKIILEKEMQDALDPTVGQSEIQELKKEIHRMQLRLEDLRKQQQKLIDEMERAVYKRETIQLKYINKDKQPTYQLGSNIVASRPPPKAGSENRTQLDKQVTKLKGTLNQTTQNGKQMDNAIRQKQVQVEQLAQQIEEADDSFVNREKDVYDKNINLSLSKLEKLSNSYRVSCMQNKYKKIEEIIKKKAKLTYPESEIRMRLQDEREKQDKIKESLEKLVNEHTHYTNLITPLLDLYSFQV